MCKIKKGGKRQGSGRKKQAPTTLINFRIKVEKKAVLKAKYGKELNKLFVIWVDSLIVNSDSV
jgi:hypothetical protein